MDNVTSVGFSKGRFCVSILEAAWCCLETETILRCYCKSQCVLPLDRTISCSLQSYSLACALCEQGICPGLMLSGNNINTIPFQTLIQRL